MDVKQEYKAHLTVRKFTAVIFIIVWGAIFVYIIYKAITGGIHNLSSIYWVMSAVSILSIALEIFNYRICRKKLKELE